MKRANGLSAAVVVLGLLAPFGVATAAPVDDARNRGLAWLLSHQNGDGSWGSKPEIRPQATLAALQALDAAKLRRIGFQRGLGWLLNARADSIDSLSQQLQGFNIAGMDVTASGNLLKSYTNYERQWGGYQQHEFSLIDTPVAFIALRESNISIPVSDSAPISSPSWASSACKVGLQQLSNGLWPLSGYTANQSAPANITNSSGHVISTVYAIRFLRTVSNYNYTCGVSPNNLIVNGLNALISLRQQSDGGFGESGASTVLDTALAYDVLRRERPSDSATAAALSYLINKQTTVSGSMYGSWSGDAFTTATVLRAFPPLTAALTDTDNDGLPDTIESILGTNSGVADSVNLAGNNGASVTGITTSTILPAATISQPYSFTMSTLSAGSSWAFVGGQLPPGITIASGKAAGTPTKLGTFSFVYRYKPSSSADTTERLAQISVLDGSGSSAMLAASSPSASKSLATSSTGSDADAVEASDKALRLSLAGSSAQLGHLHATLQAMFQPETLEMFFDDGGVAGTRTGGLLRAYRGILTGSGTDLDGRQATVWVSMLGESQVAVQALARAIAIDQLDLGACRDPYRDNFQTCPLAKRQRLVPDLALLDVDPAWSSGELDTFHDLPAWLHDPLNADERSALRSLPLIPVRFGLAVSNNVPVSALDNAAVTRLLNNQANDWSVLAAQTAGTVVRCGNTAGSGAQISAKAALGVGCDTVSGAEESPLAAADANTATCLNQAFAQGQLGIGLLGAGRHPGSADNWRFIDIAAQPAAAQDYGWQASAPRLVWRFAQAPAEAQARLLTWLSQRLATDSSTPGPLPAPAVRCSGTAR